MPKSIGLEAIHWIKLANGNRDKDTKRIFNYAKEFSLKVDTQQMFRMFLFDSGQRNKITSLKDFWRYREACGEDWNIRWSFDGRLKNIYLSNN